MRKTVVIHLVGSRVPILYPLSSSAAHTPEISAQAYSSNSASCWFPCWPCIAFLSSLLFVIPSYLNAIYKVCYFLSSMPLKIMSNKMKLKTNLSGILQETCPSSLPHCLSLSAFISNFRHVPFPDHSSEALRLLFWKPHSLDLTIPSNLRGPYPANSMDALNFTFINSYIKENGSNCLLQQMQMCCQDRENGIILYFYLKNTDPFHLQTSFFPRALVIMVLFDVFILCQWESHYFLKCNQNVKPDV